MNILKSLAVKDIEEATRAIPVIDFSPAFRSPADPEGLEAVAREVRHAGETVGFFYLAGHGVPAAVVDGAFAASREFHASRSTRSCACSSTRTTSATCR